ncbi:L,D-transpeptidase [Amycolatopsis magusensis]|uniref:Lipoprotein-anchoring transpeptidase ErfK/SrfK n=1 Tax=Amycolatopsis magusensis TaxID=882444 RepID=A0ABS4PMC3_9PSEU|nr:L,D-transpeptidase [Amycolatopsis magusensis]MBP2180024.1 lipoprotein-anchoring transpeptidase ErfK/SrfK [Amycolatopsis magusensis]
MKKLILAATGVATAVVLGACSAGGGSGAPAGAAAPAGEVAPVVTTTSPPPVPVETTTSAPAPSSTPSSSEKPTTTKPKPSTKKPAPKPKPKPAAGVPCSITSGACVDLSAKKTWILRDGAVAYGPVPITAGKKGHPTPVGTFSVSHKVKNYHSREFDAPMPNSVFFVPGIAFHSGSLSQQSHGCIHLSPGASAKYFSTLKVGDSVQVVR